MTASPVTSSSSVIEAAPAASTPSAAAPDAGSAPAAPPSVHVRALLTWLAIFPLVALGMIAIAPISGDWHPVLRALVLTIVIVPLAVYLIVPRLLRAYGALARRAAARRAR